MIDTAISITNRKHISHAETAADDWCIIPQTIKSISMLLYYENNFIT